MIEEIIALEWEMFGQVQNEGGRASCQDDWSTFHIMRQSQFACYGKKTLALYLNDLKIAKATGRNLITEKYAYMMETTHPEKYEEIKIYLPDVDEKTKALVNAVVAIEVEMTENFYTKYPGLSNRARYIHTDEDNFEETSSETYLRGELYTYSPATLASYVQDIIDYLNSDVNFIEKIVENEIKAYGYHSLEEAQAILNHVDKISNGG